jgi:hypothetical protein
VIGILSARKSRQKVKESVEWLYSLLHYHPGDHLDFAKYNNPIWDQQTPPNIVEKIPGTISQAPIHLPLRVGSGAPRLSRNTAVR